MRLGISASISIYLLPPALRRFAAVALTAPFPFLGTNHPQIFVGSDGHITLAPATARAPRATRRATSVGHPGCRPF